MISKMQRGLRCEHFMNDIFILSLQNTDQLCLIDVEDKDKVTSRKWWWYGSKNHRYAVTYDNNQYPRTILLHRFLTAFKRTDHKNGVRFDNRKLNLRNCSQRQNCANRVKSAGYTSKFKGVSWEKANKKWRAQIKSRTSAIYLGLFDDETEAAIAYNNKAKELFKEFALLNEV